MNRSSPEVRQLKDQVAEHLRAQRHRQAIEGLGELVSLEPGELQHLLKLGDSLRKVGETVKAMLCYQEVANRYALLEQPLKSISAFKLVLELDPQNQDARSALLMLGDNRFAPSPAAVLDEGRLASAQARLPKIARRPPSVPAAPMPTLSPPESPGLVLDLADADDLPLEFDSTRHPGARPLAAAATWKPPPAGPAKAPVGTGFGPIAAVATDSSLVAFPPSGKPPRLRARIPLFDDVPAGKLADLVTRLIHRRFEAGERILSQGDPGHSFFVVVAGTVRVVRRTPAGEELELGRLGEGAFFGEMALLSGAPRLADVIAAEPCELLEVADTVLRELAAADPAVLLSLKTFYRQRLLQLGMAISPLFRGCSPEECDRIASRFKLRQAAAGHVFVRQGTAPDALYLLLQGQLGVDRLGEDGVAVEAGRVQEGELFGLSPLLEERPSRVSLVARGPVLLLKLPAAHFQDLLLEHPHLLELQTAEAPALA